MFNYIVSKAFNQKIRLSFNVFGVALSVIAFISITSLSNGLLSEFDHLTTAYRGDVIIQSPDVPDPMFSKLPITLWEKLQTVKGIATVDPVAFSINQIPQRKVLLIFGLPANSFLINSHSLVKGKYPRDKYNEVIVGVMLAKELGIDVGSVLSLANLDLQVTGIYQTGNRVLDLSGIIPLSQFLTHFRTKTVNVFSLKLEASANKKQTVESINNKFPAIHAVPASESLSELYHVKLLRSAVFAFSLIAIALGMLSLSHTLALSVIERTKEIGLLRAIGWRNQLIVTSIVVEAWLTAGVGLILGMLGGYLFSNWITGITPYGYLSTQHNLALYINASLLTLIGATVASIVPAYRAISISPIEALAYE